MESYKVVKQRLELRRADLEKRLGEIKASVHKRLDPDFEEQAVERENEEALEYLDKALREELDAIQLAFVRIERNEYEQCSVCKEPIAPQRLEALPYTDRCIVCAAST